MAAADDDDDDDDDEEEEEEERGSAEDEKSLAKIARLPRTTVARGRPDVEGALAEACALARGSVSVNGASFALAPLGHFIAAADARVGGTGQCAGPRA